MTDITAGSLADFHYDYAADENNIWKIRFDHRSGSPYNQYGYDDIDRVTGVTYLDSTQEQFAMDDLGNRTGNQTLRDDGTVNFAVDTETNRYTSVAGHALTYDDAGNLTTDKDGYHFVYDYENRPERIYKLNGQTQVTVAMFDYDTQGRRIRKVDTLTNTTTLYYYSDNWQVLAEYNGTGTLQAYYAYGNYIDEVLLMHRNNADYFYLHDHLYSPAVLLDSSDSVIERYEYDAYGTCRILSPNNEQRTTSSFGNCVAFTGRELDTLDNGGLKTMHYRHREYSPCMGRFYQEDMLQYVDGLNLYEYVLDNPVLYLDSLGLVATPIPPEGDPVSPMDWAILKMDWLIEDHKGYDYASITGIEKLLPQLKDVLREVKHKYADIEQSDGRYRWGIVYLPVDASSITVFHESVHVYLDLKKGLKVRKTKNLGKHEGIAWVSQLMLQNLFYFKNIEEELKKEKPNVESLKGNWRQAWSHIAGIDFSGIPRKESTNGDIIGLDMKTDYNRQPLNEDDVRNVENYLGFRIKCGTLADKYTSKIQAKMGSCYKFKCSLTVPNGPEIGTYGPLRYDVFK